MQQPISYNQKEQELLRGCLDAGTPYTTTWDMMQDFLSLLDTRIYFFYKYHMWVGPQNNLQNMMGLVVSREEFESNLAKGAEAIVGAELETEETEEIDTLDLYFSSRLSATIAAADLSDLPAVRLICLFHLDFFESSCLLLAFAAQIEKKYEKLFAYLQDDITKKEPTTETAIRLFAPPGTLVADYYGYFSELKPLAKFFLDCGDGRAMFDRRLRLRPRIAVFLSGVPVTDGTLTEYFDENTPLRDICTGQETAERLAELLPGRDKKGKETLVIYLKGAEGSGRRFFVQHAIRRAAEKNDGSKRCLFISMRALLDADGSMAEKLNDALCEAVLKNTRLCFWGFEVLLCEEHSKERYAFAAALKEGAGYLGGCLLLVSTEDWKDTGLTSDFVKIDIEIENPDEDDRLALWRYFTKGLPLSEEIDLAEFSSKFNFTPKQIKSSVEQAAGACGAYKSGKIDTAVLHKCCYAQIVMRLDTLATRVAPAYDFDDLILPNDQILLLKEACSHVRYRHTVFREWGFAKKVAYGGGLSMLFSGPPGTGKTMTAQVIANYLHMEMYKIQLSQVVSKYIGETEKNLRAIFNEAKNANCILFFDETDALFGKRSEVKDSNDRHSNIEVAYLLQQMEEYDGVLIMATNLLQNIDAAFMRRIGFVVSFPFPDAQTRLRLWQKLLSSGAPVDDDVNVEFLARQFEIAGGNIKNIVLHAAFIAAGQKKPIKMEHLLRSAVNEQRKNNIIVIKEDLKEYADLIF